MGSDGHIIVVSPVEDALGRVDEQAGWICKRRGVVICGRWRSVDRSEKPQFDPHKKRTKRRDSCEKDKVYSRVDRDATRVGV